MSNTSKYFTPSDLAVRWRTHRATVGRIMSRYGCVGIKFGRARQAARRYSAEEVELVEHLARLTHPSAR